MWIVEHKDYLVIPLVIDDKGIVLNVYLQYPNDFESLGHWFYPNATLLCAVFSLLSQKVEKYGLGCGGYGIFIYILFIGVGLGIVIKVNLLGALVIIVNGFPVGSGVTVKLYISESRKLKSILTCLV